MTGEPSPRASRWTEGGRGNRPQSFSETGASRPRLPALECPALTADCSRGIGSPTPASQRIYPPDPDAAASNGVILTRRLKERASSWATPTDPEHPAPNSGCPCGGHTTCAWPCEGCLSTHRPEAPLQPEKGGGETEAQRGTATVLGPPGRHAAQPGAETIHSRCYARHRCPPRPLPKAQPPFGGPDQRSRGRTRAPSTRL